MKCACTYKACSPCLYAPPRHVCASLLELCVHLSLARVWAERLAGLTCSHTLPLSTAHVLHIIVGVVHCSPLALCSCLQWNTALRRKHPARCQDMQVSILDQYQHNHGFKTFSPVRPWPTLVASLEASLPASPDSGSACRAGSSKAAQLQLGCMAGSGCSALMPSASPV